MEASILVVDDNAMMCAMLTTKLERLGYRAKAVQSLHQGLGLVEKERYDVVILDIYLPDGNGLDYISGFVGSRYRPQVIIVTGDGSPDGAEKAIHGGAWTYIEKNNVAKDLPLHLMRALQYRQEKRRSDAIPLVLRRNDIIGDSASMQACYEHLAKAAASDVSVLVTGETGCGKEVFARTIHENSRRSRAEFVVVDCASLPENLIESTLFGHVKGAFTGADSCMEGLIKHADGGTLFLDEVGELPLSMQKVFLRVLQERRFRQVGAGRELHSDFRLVAATNRNLDDMVSQGHFRPDLLYRIKGLALHLPPLRERKDDIKELVLHCMSRLCARTGQELKGLSCDFLEALEYYDWPGNVRELFQTVEQAFARAAGTPTLFSIHLPESFRIRMAQAGMRPCAAATKKKPVVQQILPWREVKTMVEKDYLIRLMEQSGKDMLKACMLSGLSRARLYQLISKYSISA